MVGLGSGAFLYSWLGMEDATAMRRKYTPSTIPGVSDDEIQILYLAALAPSGHNTQPWFVRIKGPKHWIIGSNRMRWLPAVDPDNREMMLSIGAFIENLVVAAGLYGYEANIEIIGEDNYSPIIAEVRLVKGKASGFSDKGIQERRTTRKHLLKDRITEEDIRHLVGNNHNAVSYYPLHSSEGAYVSQATFLANQHQVNRGDVQAELAEWIRWTKREAREYGNGLTPESMEMEGVIRWYGKHFLSKADVLSKTFREETVKLVAEQVQNCAGWLVVKSDSSTVADLIKAGRTLQATWLRAHEKRIAFHPMTQILEEAPWRTEIANMLGHSRAVQFVVRIGYAAKSLKPVSLRMPLSYIIVI